MPAVAKTSQLPIDADFDEAFVSALAQQEVWNKHHFRPNTYLHKWWARRCGTTFRAILKALVEDESQRDFYAAGGLAGKVILDPMMGGGTTLHEAIRMGATVIGADIDPLPILQARATLSQVPLADLDAAFERVHAKLKERIGRFFITHCPTCDDQTDLRFTVYGLRKKCECREIVAVDKLTLRKNSDGSQVHIHPITHDILLDKQVVSAASWCELPLVAGRQKRCDECGQKYRELIDIPHYQRYVPLAIFGRCATHGKFFKAPSDADRHLIAQANLARGLYTDEDFPISYGPKAKNLHRRGISSYLDLFTNRQLLYIHAATEEVAKLDPLLRLNLGLLLSTSLDYNSLLCGYKGASASRAGAIKQTFVRHAYSIPDTALENNPVYGGNHSGTLNKLYRSRILQGRKWALAPSERRVTEEGVEQILIEGEVDGGMEVGDVGEVGESRFLLLQGSSAELALDDDSVDFIVTDPPYYDSVQYGELAEYFHVWLRKLVPDSAEFNYQLADSAVNRHSGDAQYEQVLTNIFQEAHRVLKKANGRFIFTFHHWKPRAWIELTLALKRAGFVLINRYVVQSESPGSVHTVNQKALLHDVILVLGPSTSSGCNSAEINDAKTWHLPEQINFYDSYTFCQQCGTTLGHLLNSDAHDLKIDRIWQTTLVPT